MSYKYITGEFLEIPTTSRFSNGVSLQDVYSDTSFVSGRNSPESMKLEPIIRNHNVFAKYTFKEKFHGPPGIVHGGILASVLDDVMGYTPVTQNIMAFTAKLEINYIFPVPVGEEFELFAWAHKIDGKKVFAESIIKRENKVYVEGKGLFIDLGINPPEFLSSRN